ncbi:MAG: deoxyribodipyrimidine photo-lyase [Acidimicrobiales bacterium]
MSSTSIAWFRRDLRLDDNPAWAAACEADHTIALVVIEPTLLDAAGPFRRDAFLHGLHDLDSQLREHGGRLRVETGDPAEIVARVVEETGAEQVHANADVTRWSQARDDAVDAALADPLVRHWGTLVQPPGSVLTKKGTLSRVFTPFHKAWAEVPVEPAVSGEPNSLASTTTDDIPAVSSPTPPTAAEIVDRAVERAPDYPDERDRPDHAGTTELSIALRFGRVSARDLARTLGRKRNDGAGAVVRQLAWRDWYAHTTYARPDIDRVALRPDYDRIEWETGDDADRAFAAWRDGRTGYPIVDAGMRQLAETGWMHNRVRMIAASFLVKDLLVDWRRGERWFRHMLADGDIPQNAGNWQWVAGTGPDAAPYFRIFNPTTQSERHDPDGTYIRRWVPELADLDDEAIHEPSAVAPLDLEAAGVTLGDTYPTPIVDHGAARDETLTVYKRALEAADDADTEK